MIRTGWKLMLAGLMVAALASAQEEAGRGVARISLMNGDVSVRRGDSGDWVAAALNAPLVVDDSLLTGTGSRAELQFDWANMIRLSSDTEVKLADLESNRYLVQVARGLVMFRVARDSDAEVEISTPSVSIRPVKKGSYRIEVNDNGESQITVRSGEAEIYTPQGSEHLGSGRTLIARGSASDPEYKVVGALGRDGWDDWNQERDRYFDRSNSYRYVDQSVYGAEDLDAYGNWVYDAPYGYVWSPRVAAGWSPYYYGRWSWIDWYGWSWVSYDPWGWAPYHYGRWYYRSAFGWCWYPGGHVRHYWSPGLVAFVGWGGGGVGLGFGRVGWIPLAPNEPYYPWYGRGYYRGYRNGTYIDNSVHIVNNTNIVNIYRNARVNNGIVGMNGSEFGRGGSHVRLGQNDLRDVSLVRGQLPVVPDRTSLRLSDRQPVATPVTRPGGTERFFSRRQPPQIERVPFEEQRRGMEQVTRRTFGETPNRPAAGGSIAGGGARGEAPARPAESGSVRSAEQGPMVRGEAPARGQGIPERSSAVPGSGETPRAPVQQRESPSGWRRFGGRPGGNAAQPAEAPAAPATRTAPSAPAVERPGGTSNNGGWRRFEPNSDSGRTARPQGRARTESQPQADRPRSEPSRVAPSRPEGSSAPEGRRSEPLRISPPIVRERPAQQEYRAAPQMERPRMESPRMSAPRNEAPRMAPSAPPRPSGIGGGRVYGGGGGGARSEGGGGRQSGGGGRERPSGRAR